MGCGIQRTQMHVLLVIQMQTGLVVWMIERVLQGDASTLNNLVSWMSKKQNSMSLSTAKAKYIAAGSCCTHLLWMKKLLHDYGIPQETMCVLCDNTSAINLSKNPVQHSKSKHIEMRYLFIRDLVEEKVVCLEFIHTDNQKADIFTKPLDSPRFESLHKTIGVGTIP